jgi:hypothetical protein
MDKNQFLDKTCKDDPNLGAYTSLRESLYSLAQQTSEIQLSSQIWITELQYYLAVDVAQVVSAVIYSDLGQGFDPKIGEISQTKVC